MNISNRSVLILLLGCIIFFSACIETQKKVIATTPVTFTKEGELSIYDVKTDSLTAKLSIEIAESDYETQTGLMYRESMDTNQGMLFIFPKEAMRSFYMKNTKIPLDIIYIDREMRIVSIQKNAQPFDESGLPSTAPAQYVLEVNAGLTDQWEVMPGDSIQYSKN